MTLANCPQSGLLSGYLSNQLPDVLASELDEHLAECAECGQLLMKLVDETPAPGWLTLARQREALSRSAAERLKCAEAFTGLSGTPRYARLRKVGAGGMGVVWEGRDTLIGRPVALKELGPGNHHVRGLQRLLQEATALSKMSHPHIVSVFDVIQCDAAPMLVMEFVDGLSLSAWQQGSPLPPRDAAELSLVIADALHHAHQHGVIHRDVKPSNILLKTHAPGVLPRDQSGQLLVKLSDFGLARIIGDLSLTISGQLPGTPSYMAPEQLTDHGRADVGTDVFSAGVLLYELLTGRPPFAGREPSLVLHMIQHHEPVPPSLIQPLMLRDLETICLKCLEREPRNRYAGAGELRTDLAAFLDGKPIAARPVSRLRKLLRWANQHRSHATLITSTALALTVAAAAGFLTASRTSDLLKLSRKSEQLAIEAANTEKTLRERAEDAEVQAIELARSEASLRSSHRQLLLKVIAVADKSIRSAGQKSAPLTSGDEDVRLDADFLANQVIHAYLMRYTSPSDLLSWSDLELAMRYLSLKQFSRDMTNVQGLLEQVDRSLTASRDAPEDPEKYVEFLRVRYTYFVGGTDPFEAVSGHCREWTQLARSWQLKVAVAAPLPADRERFLKASIAALTQARGSGYAISSFPNPQKNQATVKLLQPIADLLQPLDGEPATCSRERYLLRLTVLADLAEVHKAAGDTDKASAVAEQTRQECSLYTQWNCASEDVEPILRRLM